MATPEEIEHALQLALDGVVRVPVTTYGLDRAGEAHAALDRREHVGKLVLVRP